MTDNELRNRLMPIRAALETYWAAWALERNRPDAATGATMCRFTSAFLVLVLGDNWQVAGGEPYDDVTIGGFLHGEVWEAHYWVTDGKRIVDLTANQFDAEPVIITACSDKRYCANYLDSEMLGALSHVEDRAQAWADAFERDDVVRAA